MTVRTAIRGRFSRYLLRVDPGTARARTLSVRFRLPNLDEGSGVPVLVSLYLSGRVVDGSLFPSHPGCIMVGIAKHQSVRVDRYRPDRRRDHVLLPAPAGGIAGRVSSASEAAVGVGPAGRRSFGHFSRPHPQQEKTNRGPIFTRPTHGLLRRVGDSAGENQPRSDIHREPDSRTSGAW